MSVVVFGPLTLEGVSLSPRERSVLSALVLRADRPVTTDELADALWGDEPPGTWQKQLQASIGRVRAAIGRNAITTSPGAYTLRIDPEAVDAERFERLAASARRHLDDDPARALDAAERALELWRGTPYADLASWTPAVVEAERLDEVRMELEEARVDAQLRLGEDAASVADAERLVRVAPLRERRWVLLATALYRGGRQADALAAIRAARERLADELGAEPGAELAELELLILRHDDALDLGDAPASPSAACPYRGLQPFGVADEDDFFGRDADIEAALARLGTSRFLAVSGASGSGKSSLVRAGLVPALQRRGDRVLVLTPEHGLDARVREAVWSGRTDVVVVDQFEEVFHAGEADADTTARAIAEATMTGATVILVVRADYLGDCAAHPDLAPLVAEGVHLVGPMSPAALREAVEEPARRAGLRLEPGLVEIILRDAAGEAGALPHLSHALVETWLRREGATLTVAGYEASGGISGAIAQSADRLYQSMDPDQRMTCRWLLLRLVTLGPDGNPVRRRVPSKPLRADASREQVLSLLARSRLVTAEADSIEVAHESLATAWPRLKAWLEEDAEGTRLLTTVAAAVDAWSAAGRPEDDLLRGARLQSAIEWRDAAPRDLTDVERAFLDASAARDTAERTLFEERARQDRRQNRRLRTLLAVAAGLIVLLVGAGSVAVVSSQEAAAQRDNARLEALVSTALTLQNSERDLAALLAAEAYRRWPDDPRTRSGLTSLLQGAGGFLGNTVLASSGNAFGSLIAGTEQVLVVTTAGDASVRDPATGEVLRQLDLGFELGRARPRPLVEVSSDGRIGAVLWPVRTQLAGVASYGTSPLSNLVVFDLERGERIAGPTRIQAGTGALAVNPDGTVVALADARDGEVTLVSVPDGLMRGVANEAPVALDRASSSAAAMVFDDRGRLLVGRLGDRVDVIDVRSATIAEQVAVPTSSASVAMAIGPAGGVVASGDARLIAFDSDDGRLRWTTEIARPCNWLAVSGTLQRVFCGRLFGRISVYDLTRGTPISDEELSPLNGAVGTIEVTDGGVGLMAISSGHPIISRWRLDGGGLGRRLVAPGQMLVGPYSYEGSSLVTAQQAVRTALQQTFESVAPQQTFEGVAVLDTHTGNVTYRYEDPVGGVGWAEHGRLFAKSAVDGVYRITDMETGSPVGEPILSAMGLWPSLDGARLMAVMDDGWLRAIDPRTGEMTGDAWRLAGFPLWVAFAPDGDRVAVWHDSSTVINGTGGALRDREGARRLAIVSTDDHRVLSEEPADIVAQVMLDDGELIALEGNRMVRYETQPLDRVGTVPGAAGDLVDPVLSRDAKTLLVMATDGNALLYDAPTGTRIGEPFPTDARTLAQGYVRPDGLEMALSVPEGVMVWDIDPEHQFEYVCRIAGRDLTENEWRTYLAALGEPQSTCGFSEE